MQASIHRTVSKRSEADAERLFESRQGKTVAAARLITIDEGALAGILH